MSRYDYDRARELEGGDYPFASLIMAALMRADSMNAALLEATWPEIVAERRERYHAPGGWLRGDPAIPDGVLALLDEQDECQRHLGWTHPVSTPCDVAIAQASAEESAAIARGVDEADGFGRG